MTHLYTEQAMNDDALKSQLRRSYRSTAAAPPDFDSVWNAAEIQARGRRPYRAIAAGIAVFAAAAIFGLSQWPSVDSVRVVWPDGSETSRDNIDSNQRVTVSYPDSWSTD